MSTDDGQAGVIVDEEGASNLAAPICGKCGKPVHKRMVQCDTCLLHFHLECVRMTSEVMMGSWCCNTCLKRAVDRTDHEQQHQKAQQPQEQQQLDQQQYSQQQQQYPSRGQLHVIREEIPLDQPNVKTDQQRLQEAERVNFELRERLKQLESAGSTSQRNKVADAKKAGDQLSYRSDDRRKDDGRPESPAGSKSRGAAASLRSGSSRSSRKSAIRDHKLKALQEKQALELKQLKEKQALELTLLGSDSDGESVADTESDMSKVSDWLHKTSKLGDDNATSSTASPPPDPPRASGPYMLAAPAYMARQTVKDLPKFDGDPARWPRFIAAFERTKRMCGFRNDELLDRLDRSLIERAAVAVNGMIDNPDNVPKIIERLRVLFGNPEVVVDAMVEKINKMPKPTAEDLDSLIDFGVAVQNLCATVQASKLNEYLYNVSMLNNFVECLPSNIKMNWALYRLDKDRVTLVDFSDWMGKLVEALCKVRKPKPSTKSSRGQRDKKDEAHVFLHAGAESSSKPSYKKVESVGDKSPQTSCPTCNKSCQSLDKCEGFRKMSPQSRWAVIKDKKLCRKCLKKHFKNCDVSVKCGKNGCPFLHHQLLHDDVKHKVLAKHPETEEQTCNAHRCCLGSVMFKYVKVTVHGNGRSITTYAFMDSGSSCTLMEHSLWEELNIGGAENPLHIQWTGGQGRYEEDSVQFSVDISGACGLKHDRLRKVHTVKSLGLPEQTMMLEDLAEHYPHLAGLPIESYQRESPRMLLGMDNARLEHPLEAREGADNQPMAALTRLGWVVYGPCSISGRSEEDLAHSFHICQCEVMHAEMKQYFSFDSLGVYAPSKALVSKDDERAVEILRSKTILDGNRYTTGLLWKVDDSELPESKSMALKRTECLEKQKSRNPELAKSLQAKIDDYEKKGYIRKLSDEEEQAKRQRVWYLPIFVVTNPNKPGKLRIVWDAAAVVQGVSLNSFLLKGPDQLTSLLQVLLRFREFRTAVTGDIAEMFHQVKVNDEDQHCQRFLWNNARSGSKPSVYVMQVMTFGASCSPSCAQYVKNANAERFSSRFPEAYDAIINDHYVDDMLSSVETVEEAITLASNVRHVHAEGGFEIRGWRSNSAEVLAALNETETSEKNLNVDSQFSTEKVLGMWWNTKTDTFTFKLPEKPDQQLLLGQRIPTKKELVRVLMCIFDPLGFLAHILMYLKTLIQDIWLSGVGWDDQINAEQFTRWQTWLEVVSRVETLSIPRCYRLKTSSSEKTNVQLHTFVDASKNGLAAVVYLRYEENGVIECAFVAAKTRVAPTKLTSIPRLELQAAVLGARLAETVQKSLRIPIQQRFFWTDARNVLCWLHSNHRNYSQYVGFRVGEILEKTDITEWYYVPTKLNPADDGTKWQKTPDLTSNSRWFRGADFLWSNRDEWPSMSAHIGTTSEELKHSVGLHMDAEPLINFENFSSWTRLQRTAAFIMRYRRNLQASSLKQELSLGGLSPEELCAGQTLLFQKAQEACYLEEIGVLKKAENNPDKFRIPKGSSIYKLSPYIDERGLLRMRGRTGACKYVEHDASNPIILPPEHQITKLLIYSEHLRYHHLGHETVVNELRQKFHISKLRNVCYKVRKTCQECKNEHARPAAPLMADLPEARVAAFSRPFSYTGIDYFGPMFVAIGRRVEKRWGVLLTCLVTRAVHIEIAHSLTTDSCIMAIGNFKSRRGTPLEFFSDQGTNFIGSERELKEAYKEVDQDQLAKEFTSPATKWKFNPPASPHMGGSWERLVQSVKKILYKMHLPRNPTDEVLRNTLLEIENIINSRPLTYIPIDNDSTSALTPNHFLIGSSSGNKPLVPLDDDPATLQNNWKASQIYANEFWRRWVKEYLPTICRRTKWFQPVKPIQVGDVVVIADPEQPRNCWPMGRVVGTTVNSRDGQVRSAVVRANNRYYERPAVKLAVLDVGIQTNESKLNTGTGASVLRGSVAPTVHSGRHAASERNQKRTKTHTMTLRPHQVRP